MITNVPTADGLNQIALRLYFTAWVSLGKIYEDFSIFTDTTHGWSSDWPDLQFKEEWLDYVIACQPDLQSICSIIQQSQELALKARICTVSPYLLLLRNDARFSQTVKDIDFNTLRTLDAVELPGAVNTFCERSVSQKFILAYDQVRTLRNQIAHLGISSTYLQPIDIVGILVSYFAEIWPARMWLQDRIHFATTSRLGFFHDGSNTSATMEVMHELPYIFGLMQPAEFKRLFSHNKKTKRYLCPSCMDDASVDYANFDKNECKTGFLIEDGTRLICIMCTETFEVKMDLCGADRCRKGVVCQSEAHAGFCHVCGGS